MSQQYQKQKLKWIKEGRKQIKEMVIKKVLLNWKGQNEFVDWLEKEIGK